MEESVGQVLLKVQDDLGRLREQLELERTGSSRGSSARFDPKSLQEALAKAQSDLRMRSEVVLSRIHHAGAPVHLPQIPQTRRPPSDPAQQPLFYSRVQPHEPLPTVITGKEAKRGLLALMERGEIPPSANVILEPPPMRYRVALVHDPTTRARDRFPADAADPGYTNEGGYYLDPDATLSQLKAIEASKNASDSVKTLAKRKQPAPAIATAAVQVRQFEPPLLRPLSSTEPQPIALTSGAQANVTEESDADLTRRRQSAAARPPPTTPASLAGQMVTQGANRTVRFAVHNGLVRREASDFRAFYQRCTGETEETYGAKWEDVERLMRFLERLLQKFSIPMALVNGERLSELAEILEQDSRPSDSELLDCLVNRDEVRRLMERPGRRFAGPGGAERACVVIQTRWRGYRARKAFQHKLKRKRAAQAIAEQWKQYSKLLELRSRLKKTRYQQLERYKRRFSQLQESWDRLITKRRVIIHIPSLGYPEKLRAGISNFSRVQNTQMARLCDIRDPNVDVVLLSAVAIDDEMTQYYGRLLSGLVGPGAKVADRYKIVVPEAARIFAEKSMPLATLLKYSPRALGRIKNLIKGRPAFIVPGYPSQDDIAVADKLDVPILCPEPQVTQLYGTKSGGRRIFQAAGVPTPPGDFDVYSLTQLRESLAQLITANLSVTRWLLKLDSQFDGRGIGFIDVDRLPCYRWALKERHRYGDKWEKKWAQEKVYLRVYEELPDLLTSSAAQVACPEVYASWQQFQQDFLAQGGIVEACPPAESVTRLTVDLCVDPTGRVHLLSSGDQLTSNQKLFNCLGVSSPQCSVPPDQLNALCRRIGEACRERRIFGHASVDFVTFSGETDQQEIWAIDLSLHYSDSAALTQLFLTATGGTFDPELHEVLVKPPENGQSRKLKSKRVVTNRKPKDSSKRYATMSTRLFHSKLPQLQYAAFFKSCKANGIEFDTDTGTGSLFCLIDSFNRDLLGMVTVSSDLLISMETFARNLSVLDQMVSPPNSPAGETNFGGLLAELDEVIAAAQENAATEIGKL